MKRWWVIVAILSAATWFGCGGGGGGGGSSGTTTTISGTVASVAAKTGGAADKLAAAVTVIAVDAQQRERSTTTDSQDSFTLTVPAGRSYALLFCNQTGDLIATLVFNNAPTALAVGTAAVDLGTVTIAGGMATSGSQAAWASQKGDCAAVLPDADLNGDGVVSVGEMSQWSPTVTGVYSNASIAGVWIAYGTGDNDIYLIFDGDGGITDVGAFGMEPSSTYQVQANGLFTMALASNDGPIQASGEILSAHTATATVMVPGGGALDFTLKRVSNEGLFQGSWTGTLTETSPLATYPVSFTVDSSGRIASFTGFAAPVSGRLYGITGHAVAMIRTGEPDTNPYNQIQLNGTLSGSIFSGIFAIDSGGSSNDGTFTLTRQ